MIEHREFNGQKTNCVAPQQFKNVSNSEKQFTSNSICWVKDKPKVLARLCRTAGCKLIMLNVIVQLQEQSTLAESNRISLHHHYRLLISAVIVTVL